MAFTILLDDPSRDGKGPQEACEKLKMPPFGGAGTICISSNDVNNSAGIAGVGTDLVSSLYGCGRQDSTCCILDSLGKQVGENREFDSR
jgi:hypothetical protein